LQVKKQAFTAALLAALLASALAATLLADFAKADPYVPPPGIIITVPSPESDKAYASSSVDLTFTVGKRHPIASSIQYYLDGKMLGQLDDYAPWSFSVALTGLSEGQHCVEVKAQATYHYPTINQLVGSDDLVRVYFAVDTSVPRVAVVSAQGRTFKADVPFNFTVSKPVAWVGYCLDGADAITVTDAVVTQTYGRDNYYVVLAGLAAGSHSLIVYAEDEGGRRGESEAVSFAVAGEAQPEAEPSGSLPVDGLAAASAGVVAAVVCLSLLAYFVKFKRKRG
jgi:hypothetical protein